MAIIYACEFPDDLWYHVERDVWLRQFPSGMARLGLTDPAQTRAGRILHCQVRPHREVAAGRVIATIESGKWLGPLPAPAPGVVGSINPLLVDSPDWINRDPYGKGWVVEFAPAVPEGRLGDYGLLRGEPAQRAYAAKLEALHLNCIRCAEEPPQEGDGADGDREAAR